MSIGKSIIEQLQALAKDASAAAGAQIGEDGVISLNVQTARLELLDVDRYSATMRMLELGSTQSEPADARAYLSSAAAAVARQLAFLEEPLAVWELDGGERQAQLRSSPPLREGDAVLYWEVLLWAGEAPGARATRYRWEPGMPEREPVAYPATFALIGRIADNLAVALNNVEY